MDRRPGWKYGTAWGRIQTPEKMCPTFKTKNGTEALNTKSESTRRSKVPTIATSNQPGRGSDKLAIRSHAEKGRK